MRIKILEGRQLAGANISPVVKVILGKEAKQTRVKSSTNRPHYDEVMIHFCILQKSQIAFVHYVIYLIHLLIICYCIGTFVSLCISRLSNAG